MHFFNFQDFIQEMIRASFVDKMPEELSKKAKSSDSPLKDELKVIMTTLAILPSHLFVISGQ